jgi:hypothetical protein
MFIVTLVLSEFEGHRDVGLAMLRGLPPYQVVRVLDFIHGRKKTKKVRTEVKDKKSAQKYRAAAAPATTVVEDFGLSAIRRERSRRKSRATTRTRGRRRMVRRQRAHREKGDQRPALHEAGRASRSLFDEDLRLTADWPH